MLYNMLPASSFDYPFYCRMRNFIDTCNSGYGQPIGRKLSNLAYFIICKFGIGILNTSRTLLGKIGASFSMPIPVIVSFSAFKHVPWTHARRMITFVKNANACDIPTPMQCVNYAVCEKIIIKTITVWSMSSLPFPAGLWRAFVEKAGNACSLLWCVIGNWSKLRLRHDGLLFRSLWQGRLSIHWGGSQAF